MIFYMQISFWTSPLVTHRSTPATEHITKNHINMQQIPERRIPLELRQSGGISEAFGERVAVNLQLGYLEHERRRKCGY